MIRVLEAHAPALKGLAELYHYIQDKLALIVHNSKTEMPTRSNAAVLLGEALLVVEHDLIWVKGNVLHCLTALPKLCRPSAMTCE